jgi:hypothetical protein
MNSSKLAPTTVSQVQLTVGCRPTAHSLSYFSTLVIEMEANFTPCKYEV